MVSQIYLNRARRPSRPIQEAWHGVAFLNIFDCKLICSIGPVLECPCRSILSNDMFTKTALFSPLYPITTINSLEAHIYIVLKKLREDVRLCGHNLDGSRVLAALNPATNR